MLLKPFNLLRLANPRSHKIYGPAVYTEIQQVKINKGAIEHEIVLIEDINLNQQSLTVTADILIEFEGG